MNRYYYIDPCPVELNVETPVEPHAETPVELHAEGGFTRENYGATGDGGVLMFVTLLIVVICIILFINVRKIIAVIFLFHIL